MNEYNFCERKIFEDSILNSNDSAFPDDSGFSSAPKSSLKSHEEWDLMRIFCGDLHEISFFG